ncbi:hypothetical protein [Pseudonocardia sp. ICBG1293]|uniref:hypothetical protein n=1 Tax=Pseudonocardia sp. ICBG1293 TaxID=2844382 RepID=UPI001CCBCFA3|nr:hypothetical protein [Pseudonocardia sp. ICBG1293]
MTGADTTGTDTAGAPDTDAGDAPGPGTRPRSRRGLVVGLLVVIALLAVAAGVCAWLLVVRSDDQRTRDDVQAAATAGAQTLLSYDGRKLDAASTAVDDTTTGNFHDDYRRLFDEKVRPNAERLGARTIARVVGAGWVGWSGSDAQVLVFLNQSTTTNAGERVDTVAATLTMREVDGRWLIAGLDQV